MKIRTKQILLPRLDIKAVFNGLGQVCHIVRNNVGQLAIFAMVPNLLNRIQIRRIARKKMQFQSAFQRLYIGNHKPRLMGGQTVNHEKYRTATVPHKCFQEFDKSCCIQAAGIDRIPERPTGCHCGNSADGLTLSAGPDNRRLSLNAPGSLQRRIRANSGFVQKENICTTTFGTLLQLWVVLVFPLFNSLRTSFIRSAQRLLRRNPKFCQQTPDRNEGSISF